MSKKVREGVYKAGVIISFLGISGIAEAITGNGSKMASVAFLSVGIIMCLFGYI